MNGEPDWHRYLTIEGAPLVKPVSCDAVRDELLSARCEDRALKSDISGHVTHCTRCREAMDQLASASSETLALIVLMRGISR
jgi:hypothetical protein